MIDFIKKRYSIIYVVLIVCIILVSLFFCSKKEGYYVDEYYVYCLANGTQAGMDINVGEWNNTDRYVGHLVSEGEENFTFSQSYETIRTGTHPPLYYYLVHFISSVFSGVFSKWIGLSINIAILVPILVLVNKIAWKLSEKNEIVTLATVLLFGLSPATISMTVFIRMYLLLSLWTLLYAYIHICDLERDHLSVTKFLIPVFICGFFGFLTQYFFMVIMFFITFVYCFYLLVSCHRMKDMLIYGLTVVTSLLVTYFPWPISFFHIVHGTRGKGAFSQAADMPGFFSRFREHLGYMNEMMFGGLLPLFVVFLVVGCFLIIRRCISVYRNSGRPVLVGLSVPTRGLIMLGLAAILNFFVLAQISLMGGIKCFRHTYTSYALFLVLIPVGLYRLFATVFSKHKKTPYIAMMIGTLLIIVLGLSQNRVLFLYENEKEAMEFAKEHPDETVVMFETDDGNYDSVMQQMIMYPRVFFVIADEPEEAIDDDIANADEILVYMSKSASDKEACFDSIYRQNPKIKKAEHLWDFDFFSVYLMN